MTTLFVSFSAWAIAEVFACAPLVQGLTQTQMAQVFSEIEQFLIVDQPFNDKLVQEFKQDRKRLSLPLFSDFRFSWNEVKTGRGAEGSCEAVRLKAKGAIVMVDANSGVYRDQCVYHINIEYSDFPATSIEIADGSFSFCSHTIATSGGGNCTCPQHAFPACGSDGVTYPNSCYAACAGVSSQPGVCSK